MKRSQAKEARLPEAAGIRVLAVDDDALIRDFIEDVLNEPGLNITTAGEAVTALDSALRLQPEIILLDLKLPGVRGMELLEQMIEAAPNSDVLLLTGEYSTDLAVEAIQKGAADYLTKPVSAEKLKERVYKLAEEARRRHRTAEMEGRLAGASEFQGMVGRSPRMLEVFARIQRIAPHFQTVLVTGATGTGKEGVARALHALSPSAAGPFVTCNAGAIVETLFETELFGHTRGAFTGAVQDRVGLVEAASGGTLFLDEVAEMPLSAQAKVLRLLQNHEVQRVGSHVVRQVNARVIAATNKDLRQMVEERRFREDLYYRLAIVEIHLPPLAERRDDLPLLERHFLRKYSELYGRPVRGLTRRARTLLYEHCWPGNVREFENVLGHACMLAETDTIDVRDLPLLGGGRRPPQGETAMLSLEELQRQHARRVLSQVDGNKARAAEVLGVSRATLYRLLQ